MNQCLPEKEKYIQSEIKLISVFLNVMETIYNQVRNLSSIFDTAVCAIFVAGVGLCQNH